MMFTFERMRPLYLIPGMGADGRLFEGWSFDGTPTQVVLYLPPEKGETLAHYASRMLDRINPKGPFDLLGVSMGGMIATEISKQADVDHLVLISSAKERAELPPWWRLPSKTNLVSNTPKFLVPLFYPGGALLMGALRKPHRTLFFDMSRRSGAAFFKWAVQAVSGWDNEEPPSSVLHLHGTSDHMLPARFIKNYTPISGGDHWMVQKKRSVLMQQVEQYIHKALV